MRGATFKTRSTPTGALLLTWIRCPAVKLQRERDVVLPDGTTHAGRTPAHDTGPLSVQYRIQFLDRSGNVVREWSANAQSVARAVALIVDFGPIRLAPSPMWVLDADGREVHSAARGDVAEG
jgi:hypothetical protein